LEEEAKAECGGGVGRTDLVNDAVKELATLDVVQDEVQLIGGIKIFGHTDDVRMFDLQLLVWAQATL
jgi:hypothetical protein